MGDEARLLCPHDNTVLDPLAGYDNLVVCQECGYECPNYIQYPVEAVVGRQYSIQPMISAFRSQRRASRIRRMRFSCPTGDEAHAEGNVRSGQVKLRRLRDETVVLR